MSYGTPLQKYNTEERREGTEGGKGGKGEGQRKRSPWPKVKKQVHIFIKK